MSINYIVNAWLGSRTNGNTKTYIHEHLETLYSLEHNLSQITIVFPYHPNIFSNEILKLKEITKIKSTPVEFLHRENAGISYGSYSHAYFQYLDKFEYYIFIEDDYAFVEDNFDETLVNMINERKNCGYLCSLVWEPPITCHKKHGAISNGIAKEAALKKILLQHGNLPYHGESQVVFTHAFIEAGYEIEDTTDRYNALFRLHSNESIDHSPGPKPALINPLPTAIRGKDILSQNISEEIELLQELPNMIKTSVLIPVYNSQESVELTLKTLIAIGHKYISKINIVDNSDDTITSEFLWQFASSEESKSLLHIHKFEKKCSDSTLAHADAVNYGIQFIDTPYFMLSDSDVEYNSSIIFKEAYIEFAKNCQLFMLGHVYDRFVYTICAERGLKANGCWFFKTDEVKRYLSLGISFNPLTIPSNVPTGVLCYDFGSRLLNQACVLDGLVYSSNLTTSSFVHYGDMSRAPGDVQRFKLVDASNVLKERYEKKKNIIEERVRAKVWEKLG